MRKALLRLAIPNIIANLSIPLLSIADSAVLGHLPSTIHLAAVSLAGVVFNFILWSFNFLRMSTTGITAQSYGKQNKEAVSVVFYRSLLIALIISMVIVVARNAIANIGFGLMNPDFGLLNVAMQYFGIRIFAVPAAILNFVIVGWLLGVQDSRGAMIVVVFENVVNVGFNLWFVLGQGMAADGVALGTLIARWSSLFLGVAIVILRHRQWLVKPVWGNIFEREGLIQVFSVNGNIFIRTLSLLAVFSWFTYASSLQGTDMLALNTLLLQFFIVFSFFIDGFSFAGESLSGKFLGGGKIKALRYLVRTLMIWGAVLSVIFSLLYLCCGKLMFSLLTDNSSLIEMAQSRRLWVVLIPLVSFAAFVWDGIYAGMTHTAAMRNVMLVAVGGVFFPLYFGLEYILPDMNLWIAFLTFFVARSVGMTLARPKQLQVHKNQ
ncbi:MAG: MATE family efflux transporter [Bacteroidetes bacterium HGW-Bacteroidetes-6]|jgi:MATE family multidrug resistance protein|nr:MAG: MATE family efflux transporter [Bacteroidetes bacterium HGW-Bacteroidetes-6]